MLYVILIALALVVVFGPSLWAKQVMRSYAHDRPDFPGTGGELARHLLDTAELGHVEVEMTDVGDHYDPVGKSVRLTHANHDGRSLTAVVVAAHEVGHALQDRDHDGMLERRTRLAEMAAQLQRAGMIVMFAAPVLALLVRSPVAMLIQLGVGFLVMALPVVIHLSTISVEFDASFKRALPILDRGGYIPKQDMPAARKILKAAALTYVAASLASLLNLLQWLRIWR